MQIAVLEVANIAVAGAFTLVVMVVFMSAAEGHIVAAGDLIAVAAVAVEGHIRAGRENQ
jgi:hypothetical protein